MTTLTGKTALVTGSTSGIGLGIALSLAKAGADLILNGFGDARAVIAEVEAFGGKVGHHPADVSDPTQIADMIAYAEREFGGVDILVNNAGIQHVAAVEDFPLERWDAIIAINLSSVFHSTRLTLPGMKRKGWGRIINIASVHGQVGSVGKAAYVAAKHGVIGLTKVVGLETAGSPVTCNAICPGWVLTPLVQKQIDERIASGVDPQQAQHDLLAEKQPSLEFVTPPQLGELVLFLCSEAGSQVRGARWFPGATLNFAEHLLRRRDEHTAVVAIAEDGQREQLTYAELARHVAGLQRSLRAAGVGCGDRVAACMPNTWQTLVGMLATTSLGAIWSCSSPDFGTQGVIDRFGQIEPKVLITCAGYRYAGKLIDQSAKLNEILARLPSLEQLIIVPYARPAARIDDYQTQANVALWDHFYSAGGEPEFVAVPFDHPLYILYSSGTTGVPKCIIHGTGGVLLTHLKEHGLHADLSRDDCLFYYTTCGWMMWNWLVSVLAIGATAVLYDGSPFHPGPERLMDLIDQEQISIFGTSPKFLTTLEKAGLQPRLSHHLSSLKGLISTGSPLSPQSYDYVYREIKQELCLSSMSGGTDIVSCFVIGNPVLPVRRGEMQCKSLAMAIEVWDDQGQPLIGEKGELVCTRHFPAMPIGLWNDPQQEKLRASYFKLFPGVWAQGDYAEQRPDGSLLIHGRSDAVLNPGGVRIGTAEIYRQVEKVPQVLESLAIGQRWQDDVRVVLFVRLQDGVALDAALERQIRDVIRANTTPRHVPAKILGVTDIPRTISGKIVELAVRNVVHGETVKNTDALANPEALEQFRNRPELA